MGPRGGERWVPAPDRGPSSTRSGYAKKSEYMNGGIGTRTSRSSHWEFALTWNGKSRADVRPIINMYSGMYDTKEGTNPIYFIDPFAADTNVLSEAWSMPFMAALDAMPLIRGVRPVLSPTPVNPYDYPVRSATYSNVGTATKFYLPIPPGHTAHIGVHGSKTGNGGVLMQRITSRFPETVSAAESIPLLSVASDTHFSNTVRAADGNFGIELFLPTAGGTTTLSGLMVQILPDGKLPFVNTFISGQGHSGCSFLRRPVESPQSAAADIFGLAVELGEVGAWL